MKPGEWFLIVCGEQIPETVSVYTGSNDHRLFSRHITRGQALALYRWHGERGLFYRIKGPKGEPITVRVIGDNWAWFEDQNSSWQMTFVNPTKQK